MSVSVGRSAKFSGRTLPHAVFAIFVHVTDDDIPGGSVAEWLACWTPAQKGPGSNHSLDAVLGKLFTPTVPLHQAAKLVAALLRVAGVTAGLAESNSSLPPGL